MPYVQSNDPWNKTPPSRDQFGDAGRDVTPSDGDVAIDPYANAVVCATTGDLVIVPVQNDDDDTVTFTDVPVGFMPPYRVRTIKAATTCTVYSVDQSPTED